MSTLVKPIFLFADSQLLFWRNEEGKLKGLPLNRRVAELNDVIRGPFFISRYNEEGETVDVTPEDIKKYSRRFALE